MCLRHDKKSHSPNGTYYIITTMYKYSNEYLLVTIRTIRTDSVLLKKWWFEIN